MTQSTPDPSQTFEELLEDTLKQVNDFVYLRATNSALNRGMDIYQAKQAITQAVKQLVEGIIGEDEELPSERHIAEWPEVYRNKLKKKQRAALLKALGGSDE